LLMLLEDVISAEADTDTAVAATAREASTE
jgi:hypothetical protein